MIEALERYLIGRSLSTLSEFITAILILDVNIFFGSLQSKIMMERTKNNTNQGSLVRGTIKPTQFIIYKTSISSRIQVNFELDAVLEFTVMWVVFMCICEWFLYN